MTNKTATWLLRISAILWGIWGVFHFAMGVVIVAMLATENPEGDLSAVPVAVDVIMMGKPTLFAIVPALQQLGFLLAVIGAVVSIGCVYMWKKNAMAIVVCALTGGLADLGYFLCVDLAGYAEPPGPQMTYISASAVILSLVVFFKTDHLRSLPRL